MTRRRDATALLAADRRAECAPLSDPGPQVGFAGDWHGKTSHALDALDTLAAAGVRTAVQTGNFGILPDDRDYLDAVAGRLAVLDMALLFVEGNHEDYGQLLSYPIRKDGLRVIRPRLYHLPRAFRWTWPGGLRCLALGGAVSMNRAGLISGVDYWPEAELTLGDLQRAAAGGQVDLMITHDCPAGVALPDTSGRARTEAALRRSRDHKESVAQIVHEVRPARLVHGHMHSRAENDLPLPDGSTCKVSSLDQQGTPGNLLITTFADLRSDTARRDRPEDRRSAAPPPPAAAVRRKRLNDPA